MVYAHALGRQKFVMHPRIYSPPPFDKSCKVLSPIALLFVNKQVHQEAFRVLYEQIEYQVWLHDWNLEFPWHLPWNLAKIIKLSIRIQLGDRGYRSWSLWYKELAEMDWSVLRQMTSLRSLRLEILTPSDSLARSIIDEFKRQDVIQPVRQMMRNFVVSIHKSVATLNFGEEDTGEEADCEDTYFWDKWVEYLHAPCYQTVRGAIHGKYMLRVYEEIKALQSADVDS
jgi:hypothetical protein